VRQVETRRPIAIIFGVAATLALGAADDTKTWVDDGVTVRASSTPVKRQDFLLDIPAPANQVWRALTTAEGIQEYFPSKPNVELKVGGPYELFPGSTNRVLTFIPGKMLMTTGSAPPQFPEVRKGGTWGTFQFEPIDDGKATRLNLAVIGWRDGQEWDNAFAYFLKNNPVFLRMIRKRFVDGPLPSAPAPRPNVELPTVIAKALHKEVEVSAPREEIWKCWTTPDGMRSFFAAESKIELKPGGAYELYMGPPSAGSERGSEGCKVLGYLPDEVLSFDWNAPPKFPEIRKQRTCVVIRLESAGDGKTRVLLDHHGFGKGKDWDDVYIYFDRAWDHVLDSLRKRFEPK
jgi:uncharacterized protein YndB with AHSA1/START domain